MSKFSWKNVKDVKYVDQAFLSLFMTNLSRLIHAFIDQNHANKQFGKKVWSHCVKKRMIKINSIKFNWILF